METLEEALEDGWQHLGRAIDKFQDADMDEEKLEKLESIHQEVKDDVG